MEDASLLEEAAYRGTLRACSTMAFVLAAFLVPFVLLGALTAGPAAVAGILLGPVLLVLLGFVLRALAPHPQAGDTSDRAQDVA